jgi:hypothetical protein
MLNILAFAFYRDRMLRWRGERRPFLVGFQVAGWMSVIAYLVWCWMAAERTSWLLVTFCEPIRRVCMDNLDFETMKRLDPTFALPWPISTFAALLGAWMILTGLVVLVAWLGGWIGRELLRPRHPIVGSP